MRYWWIALIGLLAAWWVTKSQASAGNGQTFTGVTPQRGVQGTSVI